MRVFIFLLFIFLVSVATASAEIKIVNIGCDISAIEETICTVPLFIESCIYKTPLYHDDVCATYDIGINQFFVYGLTKGKTAAAQPYGRIYNLVMSNNMGIEARTNIIIDFIICSFFADLGGHGDSGLHVFSKICGGFASRVINCDGNFDFLVDLRNSSNFGGAWTDPGALGQFESIFSNNQSDPSYSRQDDGSPSQYVMGGKKWANFVPYIGYSLIIFSALLNFVSLSFLPVKPCGFLITVAVWAGTAWIISVAIPMVRGW